MTLEHCVDLFNNKFGVPAVQLSVPGRANIIGEHTDYNQGFVLPFAIDKYIFFAASKSDEISSQIYSLNLDQSVSIDPDKRYEGFAKFMAGCLKVLGENIEGDQSVNVVFGGNLPIGAGISSSSALCCGFLEVLSRLFELNLSAEEILKLAISVERGAGVEGGIMDQFTIINAKENRAILLDCLDDSIKYVPFDLKEYSFVIFDTKVAHNLADTAYNDRVKTCRSALQRIQAVEKSVANFRAIKRNHLQLLEGKERERIEHVVNENERVLVAVDLLESGDVQSLGKLINQSHASLRDLYEVSCNELDFIAAFLQGKASVAGARMMGGGFGGSVIALMRKDNLESIAKELALKYKAAFNIQLRYFRVNPSDGIIERR